MSYIWESKKRDLLNWTICTWSKYISNSYISQHGNINDKQYLPADYVYLPRKKKTDETAPAENNNNKRRKVNNNNNNNNNNKNNNSRKKKATTKQANTGRTRSVADMFAAAFAPDPVFIERAKATANQENIIDVEDEDDEVVEIEESGDQSNPNSTDPSLIVQLPGAVNDGTIPNASRTTAADFEATVTTILDAAGINGD